MNQHRLRRAFAILQYSLGLVVLAQSISTAVEAAGGGSGVGHNPHLVVLAAVEAVAAVLFMVPKTLWVGGIVLLGVFAVALAVHALRGEFASTLVVYAAAVGFVMAHGPVVGVRSGTVPDGPPH